MNTRERNLLRSVTDSGPAYYAWVALLTAVVLWGAFAYVQQLRSGLIVTGMGDQISWGLYISNFVFFIGISHAGTLISAILRVTGTDWRRPITRMAESITVVSLFIGASMVTIDMGRPERMLNLFIYGRIQSPIIWDVLGVTTYLTGSLLYFYLPLIPDLAILSSQTGLVPWRRHLYSTLALGWRGTPGEWKLLEKAISVMAVVIIPLAVSVHTVVAWIFAMTLRPGWDSSIFGPYFVVGAIYSGAAAVVLTMCVLRQVFGLEEYLEPLHFRKLGLLLLSFSLAYLYFNINEYLTPSYKYPGGESHLLAQLFHGRFSAWFWAGQIVCIVIPLFLMIGVLALKRYQSYIIPGLALASVLIIIGAWIKRFIIVVPPLSNPSLPIQRVPENWLYYMPSWVEWSITAGAFAAFLLLYTVVAKLFPVVSVWETRSHAPIEENNESPASAFGPSAWGSVRPALLLFGSAFLAGAISAKAQAPPNAPQPTTLSVEWRALPDGVATVPAEAAAAPTKSKGIYLFTNPVIKFLLGSDDGDALPPRFRVIAVSAQLRDPSGGPLAYKVVDFFLKTSFGTLGLGSRPTDVEGKVELVMRDRRYGRYPVTVAFEGDYSLQGSRGSALVDFGPRPSPALPAAGVLISPYFTPEIGIPFLFFYGLMWVAFTYTFGYLVVWRMRRERARSANEWRVPRSDTRSGPRFLDSPDQWAGGMENGEKPYREGEKRTRRV